MKRHRLELGLPALGVLGCLGIWECAVLLSPNTAFPSPAAVARGLRELFAKGVLFRDIWDSLARVMIGYWLAIACGVPFGLLLGWQARAAAWLDPLLQLLRPISPLAWTPLAVVWFGIGDRTAIFLIFTASFFPVVLAAMSGVRNIPAVHLNVARNFHLSPGRLASRVLLPAALPQIFIGIRVALGVAWLVVVAAEMVAVNSGLGYLVIDSRNAGKRYDLVVAAMILIGLVGLLLDTSIQRLQRLKILSWGMRNE
jgi:NitT/TauT family transport system permease protein